MRVCMRVRLFCKKYPPNGACDLPDMHEGRNRATHYTTSVHTAVSGSPLHNVFSISPIDKNQNDIKMMS
jgi:hypothetical protein